MTSARPKRMENTLTKDERDKLIEEHFDLVAKTTNAICKKQEAWEDCFGEAQLGLVLAAKYYNPNLGVKFTTFAINEMRYRILDFLYKNKTVRLPEDYRGRLSSFRSIVDDKQQDEIEISSSVLIEAARECGLNTAVLQVELNPATSLDKTFDAEENLSLKELLQDKITSDDVDESILLKETIQFLREYSEEITSRNEEFTKWFRIHMNNICDVLEGKAVKAPCILDLIREDYPEWCPSTTDDPATAKEKAHKLDNKYCAFNSMWRNALKTRVRPHLVARDVIAY